LEEHKHKQLDVVGSIPTITKKVLDLFLVSKNIFFMKVWIEKVADARCLLFRLPPGRNLNPERNFRGGHTMREA
jgi:hypothetical protein